MIRLYNDLVSSGNKPLTEPELTKFYHVVTEQLANIFPLLIMQTGKMPARLTLGHWEARSNNREEINIVVGDTKFARWYIRFCQKLTRGYT